MADHFHADLKKRPVEWRRLLLPNEHGSWAFVLEPLVLGLLVAFSPTALWVTLAVILGFFCRKPTKYAFATSATSVSVLRQPARLAFLALSLGAIICFASAVAVSRWQILVPVATSLPALLIFALREQRGQVRSLLAELIATGLCSAPLISIALAAHWTVSASLALGFINLARAWPSLLFVRFFLRESRGNPGHKTPTVLVHAITPLLLFFAAQQKLIPASVVAINVILSLRAALLLLCRARYSFSAKQLGVMELFWGLLYLCGVSFAFHSWH